MPPKRKRQRDDKKLSEQSSKKAKKSSSTSDRDDDDVGKLMREGEASRLLDERLEQVELEMKSRCEGLREHAKYHASSLRNRLKTLLFKFPHQDRTMRLREYLAVVKEGKGDASRAEEMKEFISQSKTPSKAHMKLAAIMERATPSVRGRGTSTKSGAVRTERKTRQTAKLGIFSPPHTRSHTARMSDK